MQARLALLLFGSGFCALVYQTAWLRQLRLLFGASTPASSAVLAVFMGGLGLGGWFLGRRADRDSRPLRLYGNLELGVAGAAAISPLLLAIGHASYVASGGASALGSFGATLARLLVATLVLGLPTVLMGGTLPAAVRAATGSSDVGRRGLAWLYGANTLGALAGVLTASFFALETFGNRDTLWLACALNAAVGLVARRWSSREPAAAEPALPLPEPALAPRRAILAAAGIVGFAFLLMELVWFRMLAPILGGSSYTFAIILAVALFGIGLGGASWAASQRRATVNLFGITCALEALAMALPLAAGDQIAIIALQLRSLDVLGFAGLVGGWFLVTAIVVLPASFAAGFQFPVIVSLLGRGDERVGDDLGRAYAINTLGAIVGSLAGGFGLIPLLGAPGVWRAVVVLLALTALASMLIRRPRPAALLLVATVALILVGAVGPTAAWRHLSIGVGRVQLLQGVQQREELLRRTRGAIRWEVDGVESSVAVDDSHGISFLLNGKVDGSCRGDAGTQVMAGLIGTLLHPAPKRALVIGLGSGSSAGWLADVPGMERVDVVELEPAVIEVARMCADVNRHVLENPRVKLQIGDAREVLLTAPASWDVIFSEPSNPYRAGVSNLFTRELYRSVEARLEPDGVFLQWLQTYDIDASSFGTIFATLQDVFPHVEIWQSDPKDLLIVAARQPLLWNAELLRQRIATPPWNEAVRVAWEAVDLESVAAHYVGGPRLAAVFARHPTNLDDRNRIEFAMARAVGRTPGVAIDELRRLAESLGDDWPRVEHGAIDRERVRDERLAMAIELGARPAPETLPPQRRELAKAYVALAEGRLADAWAALYARNLVPRSLREIRIAAYGLAALGDDRARPFMVGLERFRPTDAIGVRALLAWNAGRRDEAAEAARRFFLAHRKDPWVDGRLTRALFAVANDSAAQRPEQSAAWFELFGEELAVHLHRRLRLETRLALLSGRLAPERCVEALADWEPDVPWRQAVLESRLACYRAHQHPLAEQASADLERFLANEPEPLPDSRRGPESPAPASR